MNHATNLVLRQIQNLSVDYWFISIAAVAPLLDYYLLIKCPRVQDWVIQHILSLYYVFVILNWQKLSMVRNSILYLIQSMVELLFETMFNNSIYIYT